MNEFYSHNFYYGVATDNSQAKTPKRAPVAVDDIVYYQEARGTARSMGTVDGYWLDDNGHWKISVKLFNGEKVTATPGQISY